ncbi:FHA domain-containing protein [Psychromicrobium lacuslunae]|uniref:FHA domain-containing protein n=1 Tax=Psychromicrobium lacuslunae TaxID=1618207 RepID=A0A0D4BWG6_9MICC|nr:FHA domain-containing protein [Psychromicrobium lacuslunae]AJT40470.1 hypothetical protein UM93_00945 [Psychromicrobium lacuslunae]
MNTNYTPGTWLGIIRSATVIVLDENTPSDIVRELWDFLGSGPQIHEVLNKVTASFGTELTGMPSFGILTVGAKPRAVLRGEMSLTVRNGNTELEVSGREVTTWSERSLPAAELFSLRLGQLKEGELQLPLAEGVVKLAGLQVAHAEAELPSAIPPVKAASESADQLAAQQPISAGPHFAADPALPTEGLVGAAQSGESNNTSEAAGRQEPIEALAPTEQVEPAQPADPIQPVGLVEPEAPKSDQAATAETISADSAAEQVAESADPSVAELDLSQTLISSDLSEAAGVVEASEPGSAELPLDANGAAADNAEGTKEQSAPTQDEASVGQAEPDEPLFTEAPDNTTSYDHLWDRTVSRSVEDAAIRAEENPEGSTEAASGVAENLGSSAPGAVQPPQGAEAPAPPAPTTPTTPTTPATPAPITPAQAPTAASTPGGPIGASGFPAAPVAAPGGALIDSVPWLKTSNPLPSETSAQAGFSSAPSAPSAQPTPVAPSAPPAGPSSVAANSAVDSDHDGHTVMRSELEVPEAPSAPPQSAPTAPGTGAMVLARLCGNGHANPPTYARCAQCGQPIMGEAFQVRRPVLGQMRISSGEVIDLDRSLIIGRQPSVSRVNGEGMPRLIQVKSQAGDISRSHVEIRLEGWDVVLVDLKATNGTVLVREGQPPRRLGQGEQALLLNGDIAELGEDVSLRFEGLL